MQILHHHIASVEKLSLTTTGCPLFIQCRNFRVVHFVVQRERDCHDVYSSLLRLLRPGWFHCVKVFNTSLKGCAFHEGVTRRIAVENACRVIFPFLGQASEHIV